MWFCWGFESDEVLLEAKPGINGDKKSAGRSNFVQYHTSDKKGSATISKIPCPTQWTAIARLCRRPQTHGKLTRPEICTVRLAALPLCTFLPSSPSHTLLQLLDTPFV